MIKVIQELFEVDQRLKQENEELKTRLARLEAAIVLGPNLESENYYIPSEIRNK